ncbi:MAG: hypothetical protein ACE5OS_15050, partial [Anaerolineae bacterium]
MSERPRNEKEEKEEKGKEESWEEKWRRDPLNAALWAIVLIWAGLVLIAINLDIFGTGWDAWPVIFLGAGVIVLLGVVVRLLVPAYRRPVTGSIIFGFILLGIGLGELTRWDVVGALVLIAIGVSIL